jgi:hypothetical protein
MARIPGIDCDRWRYVNMTDENSGGRAFGVALALYALVICVTALRARPPAAKPANAPADEFSGVRAKNILRQLVGNGVPHPVGSTADAAVRDGIVAQLTQLGYQPRVQEGFACEEGRCTDVKNILARLDGREAGPAVMLAAHYDSVPAGPGASDDGAGIVSELEIARALKASPPLRHSIIFLMDEGEEAGLLGAAAFVQDDPWAKDVRAVVNMDNRGSSGPVTMFETGNANERVLRVYAKAVRHPNANSLSYTVYKSLPNDTDFTVFKHAGYQGLNFAFIDGVAHYHTPLDNVANASAASIQNEGEDGLEAVHALANSDLNFGTPSEAVYSDVFGWKMIWWPARWTVGFALLAIVLLLFEIGMLARRRQIRIREFALGLASWPLILIVGAIFGAILQFFLRVAGATPANWVAHPAPMLFAVWAMGFGAVALIAVLLGRRAGFWGMWSGIWIWWGIVALALGIFAPGLSFVFVVPALAAAIFGLAIVSMRSGERRSGAVAALIPAFVTALVGVYSVWFLYSALGGAFLTGITVCVALIAAPLAPLAGAVSGGRRWAFPAMAIAIAIVATAAALFVPPFSAASPQPMDIEYYQNADAGKSQWLIYANSRRLPLSMRSLMPFVRAQSAIYPWDASRPFAAAAPALNLPAPTMTVQQASSSNGKSNYDLLLKSVRGAPEIVLAFAPDNAPESVTINGHAVPELNKRILGYTHGWRIYGCMDAPPEGIEMRLTFSGTKSVSALLLDQSYGLPPQGMFLRQARPVTATAIQSGDVTVITRHVTFAPQ